ncbi:Uncharacterized protein HZ326_0137 [Fusarium oxysporum f. sp. albedinis]|nr:Uncharacterized protein HZ326_0137 [Fusarium oxysporum f. sp. albedinis]
MLFSKDGRGLERRHSQERSTGAGGFRVEEPSTGNNPQLTTGDPGNRETPRLLSSWGTMMNTLSISEQCIPFSISIDQALKQQRT